MKVKCSACGLTLGTRSDNTIRFGAVVVQAPADVMCSRCGFINKLEAVPVLTPKIEPKK